jgi:hypothetical protein
LIFLENIFYYLTSKKLILILTLTVRAKVSRAELAKSLALPNTTSAP